MINRISIKNFKSLNVDVELDPVTVLVGRSGAGKSNFVEALRFLRKALSVGVSDPDKKYFPFIRTNQTSLEYHVEFSVHPFQDVFAYDLTLAISNAGFSITKESLSTSSTTFFHRENSKWITAPNIQSTPSASSPHSCFLSTLNGIQQISVACIALTKGLGCYDFPGNVCAIPKNNSNNTDTNLLDDAENYINVFDSIRNDLSRFSAWDAINKSLQTLNGSFRTIDMESTQSGKRVVVAHEFGGKTLTFDISQESEGFRRFFAHLLALYQSPSKQTMLFEEPERGIHPAAMETLAEALKRCPEEGRGQVILTTHSPELLDHFEPESIRAVEIHDGETRIGRISKEQLEAVREFLYRPGQLLTVEDARIDETEYSLITVTEV